MIGPLWQLSRYQARHPPVTFTQQPPWRLAELKTFEDTLAEVVSPHVSLKRHQVDGAFWVMSRLICRWPGGILADGMGMGKTATALAAAGVMNKRYGASIHILCPATLKSHWQEQVSVFLRAEFRGSVSIYSYDSYNPATPPSPT